MHFDTHVQHFSLAASLEEVEKCPVRSEFVDSWHTCSYV